MIIHKFRNHYLPEALSLLFGRNGPVMVSVNLTDRCNQHCIYCEIGTRVPSETTMRLTKDDLFELIDHMSVAGIKRLSMCGGEPFLFDGLHEVVNYAHQNKIRCNLTSNGMVISRLNKTVPEVLKKCGAWVNISVDSFDESIQSLTRGHKEALRHATEAIKVLQQYQIPVTILSTITRHNFRDLFDSLVKAHDLGLKQVLYQPVIYHSNFPDREVLSGKKALNVMPDDFAVLKSQLLKIKRYEKHHPVATNVYRLLPWIEQYIRSTASSGKEMFFSGLVTDFYCREADSVIDIGYNGTIQACGLISSGYSIRDIRKRGLIELYRTAGMKLKAQLKKGNFPAECNACCHKFSRNLIASVFHSPWRNRKMLFKIAGLMAERASATLYKRIAGSAS